MTSINIVLILITLIQTLFLIRFHYELSNINAFLKPITILRKLTNPILIPLRKLVPKGLFSTLMPLLIAYIAPLIILLFINEITLKQAFSISLIHLINNWMRLLQYGIIIYVILSWVRIPQLQQAYYLLHHFFTPVLDPIRKIVPSFSGIDFSPLILMLGISYLIEVIQNHYPILM